MDSLEAQREVVAAVKARGYWDGFNAEQVATRQVCKLAEELAELADNFVLPVINGGPGEADIDPCSCIQLAGEDARATFDMKDIWDLRDAGLIEGADPDNPNVRQQFEDIKSEMADCIVVLFNLAGALAQLTGEEFDPVARAVEKSTKDVERGVRG